MPDSSVTLSLIHGEASLPLLLSHCHHFLWHLISLGNCPGKCLWPVRIAELMEDSAWEQSIAPLCFSTQFLQPCTRLMFFLSQCPTKVFCQQLSSSLCLCNGNSAVDPDPLVCKVSLADECCQSPGHLPQDSRALKEEAGFVTALQLQQGQGRPAEPPAPSWAVHSKRKNAAARADRGVLSVSAEWCSLAWRKLEMPTVWHLFGEHHHKLEFQVLWFYLHSFKCFLERFFGEKKINKKLKHLGKLQNSFGPRSYCCLPV